MGLLGDRNWWIPPWLDRWLPRLQVGSGDGLDAEPAVLTEREQVQS